MIQGNLTTTQQVTLTYGDPSDQSGNPAVLTGFQWQTSDPSVAVVNPVSDSPIRGLIVAHSIGSVEVWVEGVDSQGIIVQSDLVQINVGQVNEELVVTFGLPVLGTVEEQSTNPGEPLVGKFVSTVGSDNNDGSESAPYRTVLHALQQLSPGDTLYVRGGTYDENITWAPQGAEGNRITVKNYPNEKPWIAPTVKLDGSNVFWLDCDSWYVDFDGINVDGRPSKQTCFWASTNNGKQPHHLRVMNAEMIAGETGGGAALMTGSHSFPGQIGHQEFINLKISGGGLSGECGWQCASYGIYINSPNNLIEGCDISDPCGAGIQLYSKLGEANNNIIRNNIFRDIGRSGDPGQIYGILCTGADNQIYNNLIYNITKQGTQGNADAAISITNRGNKILHNTIFNVANAGINVGVDSGGGPAVGTIIQNNIVFMAAMAAFNDGGSNEMTESNNLWNVDPLFVNLGAGPYDFHPSSNSPAIDAGIDVGITTDIEGDARPSPPTIGAYENPD